MSQRRLYLDRGIGEVRGVVTLDGQPERLFIHSDDEDAGLRAGARLTARVASVEPAIGTAFLDLGAGREAILSFKPQERPVRGAAVEIEIRAEARAGKLAVARMLGGAEGAPRVLAPAPEMAELLRMFAKDEAVIEGREAREAADQAEADALEVLHPLPGGGTLAIEPTRALTAVDVDLGERKGADAKRAGRQANLAALSEAARLLRLKGLGGLTIIDLVGRGHDGAALLTAARLAFAPDNPGVAIGPVGRFGTMEISVPRRTRPNLELLGGPSYARLAQHLLRRIEDEARAQPGARLLATAAPAVVAAAEALAPILTGRIGARFTISADAAYPRTRIEVSTS